MSRFYRDERRPFLEVCPVEVLYSIFLQHFAYMVQLVYPFDVVCVGSIDQLSSQLCIT